MGAVRSLSFSFSCRCSASSPPKPHTTRSSISKSKPSISGLLNEARAEVREHVKKGVGVGRGVCSSAVPFAVGDVHRPGAPHLEVLVDPQPEASEIATKADAFDVPLHNVPVSRTTHFLGHMRTERLKLRLFRHTDGKLGECLLGVEVDVVGGLARRPVHVDARVEREEEGPGIPVVGGRVLPACAHDTRHQREACPTRRAKRSDRNTSAHPRRCRRQRPPWPWCG